jgi:uncharacterized repeat protein (TIGR01451 family)
MIVQRGTCRIQGGRPIVRLSLSLACLLAALPASAQTVADSSAFGESVNLSVAPLLGANLPVASGPSPQVAGTAAPAYSKTATTAAAGVSTPLTGALVQTGVLVVNASSQMPAAVATHADATTNNLAVTLGHLLPLLTLGAQTVRADATIDGTCGAALTATGSANITGAATGGSVALGLSLPAHPAANTQLLNLLGVRILLNEQIQSGDGKTQESLTVNAIHITLQNSLLSALGLLTGDIVISQARADVECPTVEATSADLSLTGSAAPSPVAAGGTLQYQFTVTNQGPDPATGVTLADVPATGLTGTSITPSQGSCVPGPPVSCNLGTIAAGQSAQVGITATVATSQGTLVSAASVASGVADPNPGNNSVTLSTPIASSAPEGADLALTATPSAASVQQGMSVTIVYNMINNGPLTASAVSLSMPLADRVMVLSVNTSQGTCGATTANPVVCSLGTLAPGGQATVTMTLNPQSPGTMICQGTVTSSVADPDSANNTGSATVNVTSVPLSPLAASHSCRIDAMPAATLLFPYFEVDLDHPNGATTLISINNAGAATQLAQVTLWSDWGIPTLSFTLQLTGYDVQTLNLRDVIGSGVLPPAGTGCGNATVAGPLSATTVGHLQAWHTGRQSPLLGNCAAPPRDSNLATGYITVDAVNRCTTANPTTAGYFAANGTGIASDNNVLWGDLILVNADQNLADGDPAVHILAEPGVFTNHYSFYGSFVNGTGADDRQPLGTSYASRYVSGGAFDGGTQLIVWRDAKVANPTPLGCGQEPARMEVGGTAFDEEENASLIATSKTAAPWSTQKITLGGTDFPLPHPFGWLNIDLWHATSPLFGNVAQGWVTTIMVAQQRYSVGMRAIRLDSACDF